MIEKNKTIYYTTIIFIFTTLLSLLSPPDYESRNINYRIQATKALGAELAQNIHETGQIKWQDNGDCFGSIFLMGLGYYYEGISSKLPTIFILFHMTFAFIALICLWLFLKDYIGVIVASLVSSLYAWSPHFRHLAFSFDVYTYTAFAVFFFWLLLHYLLQKDIKFLPILILTLLISVCSFFRTNSFHVLFGLPLFLAYFYFKKKIVKKQIVYSCIVLLFSFIVTKTPNLFLERTSHVTWHPLHAGLFEFGGIIKEDMTPIPNFAITENDLKNKRFGVNRWDDAIEFSFAKSRKNDIKIYSDEYEDLLKEHFFELIKSEPIGYAQLILMRLLRILNFSPFLDHTKDSLMLPKFVDYVFSTLSLLIILYAFYLSSGRVFWIILVASSSTILSPLLVHSGYIMYNYPTIVTFTFALVYSIFVIYKKILSEKRLFNFFRFDT